MATRTRRRPVTWGPSSAARANTSAVPGSVCPSTAAGTIGYGECGGGRCLEPERLYRHRQPWLPAVGLSHVSAAAQTVVMDTNQHGVRISAAGNWSMRYANSRRRFGRCGSDQPVVARYGGASLWHRDTVAVGSMWTASPWQRPGAITGDDNASLVFGSNTSMDVEGNFVGGTEEFFSGVMDNLEMFVLGTSTGANPEDFGTFDPETDNEYVAGAMAGVPDGDVDMDGALDPVADVDAFVAGWLNANLVNGIRWATWPAARRVT